jgi:hypothetical protein
MEKLDKERYLKRVIIVCWIALAICFGIKLFGGNLFEIMCENENFIKVCEYADNHFWAKYLIGLIYSIISMYFFVLAICQRWKYEKWELSLLVVSILVCNCVKIISPLIGAILDIWQGLILPMILKGRGKKQCILCLIGNGLLLVFQLLSMFAKNLGLSFITSNGVLISAIFSIDVILMVLLYYLYSNITRERKAKE